MTVDEILHLAQQIYTLLPSTRIDPWSRMTEGIGCDWCTRLEQAFLAGGLDPVGAVVLGDTLASHVGLAMCTRFSHLDGLYDEALTAFDPQAGSVAEAWGVHLVPAGELGVAHIASLIDWWLCRVRR